MWCGPIPTRSPHLECRVLAMRRAGIEVLGRHEPLPEQCGAVAVEDLDVEHGRRVGEGEHQLQIEVEGCAYWQRY